jgi:hypothetical protein
VPFGDLATGTGDKVVGEVVGAVVGAVVDKVVAAVVAAVMVISTTSLIFSRYLSVPYFNSHVISLFS